jgi:hypothetical protein
MDPIIATALLGLAACISFMFALGNALYWEDASRLAYYKENNSINGIWTGVWVIVFLLCVCGLVVYTPKAFLVLKACL